MTSSRSRITGKGLHISVQTDILASSNECTLSILYALPASFILDVFQLAELIEENRLTNLTSLRVKALQLQESDLELPFEQVEDRISVAWFDLGEVKEDMRVALPLHLRTHLPQNKERLRNISLREPMVLNSCEAGRFDGLECSPSSLGINSSNVFDPRFLTHATCSWSSQPRLYVQVPVGSLEHLPMVQRTNLVVVWSCVLAVLYIVFRSSKGSIGTRNKKNA